MTWWWEQTVSILNSGEVCPPSDPRRSTIRARAYYGPFLLRPNGTRIDRRLLLVQSIEQGFIDAWCISSTVQLYWTGWWLLFKTLDCLGSKTEQISSGRSGVYTKRFKFFKSLDGKVSEFHTIATLIRFELSPKGLWFLLSVTLLWFQFPVFLSNLYKMLKEFAGGFMGGDNWRVSVDSLLLGWL